VPIEHDEGGQLDTPRVQHVTTSKGLLSCRPFQATPGTRVGAGQEPGDVGTNRFGGAYLGSSYRRVDRTAQPRV